METILTVLSVVIFIALFALGLMLIRYFLTGGIDNSCHVQVECHDGSWYTIVSFPTYEQAKSWAVATFGTSGDYPVWRISTPSGLFHMKKEA